MQSFMKVGQVMEILQCSQSKAYKVMKQLNNELEKDGYLTIDGRISRDYLCERLNIRQQGEREVK